jgi:hypothetical protein
MWIVKRKITMSTIFLLMKTVLMSQLQIHFLKEGA